MKKNTCNRKRCGAVLSLCLLWICGMFVGCSNVKGMVSGVAAAGQFPVKVGEVTIGAKPQKAVVLSSSLADVILALGDEVQLAAGSSDCTQESLRDLTKISGTDAGEVLELSPDLVLMDTGNESLASTLRDGGLTVLEIAPATDREDFERLYAQVSSAFSGEGAGYDAGIDAAQDIFETLDSINRIVPKDKVITACYLYDLEGRAVTGDTLTSTVMSYAGVTNVFNSLEGGTYTFESLRVSNPDVIFCVPGLKEQIKADSRFLSFRAVQNGNVVEIDPQVVERQGRTVVECAYEICAAAFPELLQENSMQVTDPTEDIDSQVSSAINSMAEESDTTEYPTLSEGDQGEDVLKVQQRLDELGYLTTEYDGHYGAYTAGCVEEFQQNNGLEVTGIADGATQRRLFSKNAKAASEGSEESSAEE